MSRKLLGVSFCLARLYLLASQVHAAETLAEQLSSDASAAYLSAWGLVLFVCELG
jgi:hypothetical protein